MTLISTPDRTKMPLTSKQIQLQLDEPEHIKLDNGIDTFIINKGEEGITRLDIIIDAGTSIQTKNLVAASTIRLLIDGTTTLSSADIAHKIDYHGAYIDTSITKDKACITLYSLNKYLPELVPLIGDMLTNASFSESELSNYLERKRHQFILNNDKVRYKAMLEFNRMVFGSDSAYGRIVELPDFDNLKRIDVLDFYKSHFCTDNLYVLISGNVGKDTIDIVNKHLGNISKTKSIIPTDMVLTANIESMDKYVQKKDALQSAIRIGKPIISKNHPDYNSLIVLNTVLGGYFGSRLMSNLRENKGFTYGVSSYMMNYKHGGFFSVATEVNVQHTQAAMDQIKFEIDKLCNEKIGDQELSLVKSYIYGTYLRSFDGPLALAERYRSAKNLGLNFEYYANSLKEMMEQSPEQLLDTANKYFNYNDMIKLIVGSLDKN